MKCFVQMVSTGSNSSPVYILKNCVPLIVYMLTSITSHMFSYLLVHVLMLLCLCFVGLILASGAYDNNVVVWDVENEIQKIKLQVSAYLCV